MPMLPRACLFVLVIGASGCFRNAKLATAREAVETFNAPVKCGPMGFRRIPVEARFGEYVRLTVASPVPLSGSVMVHAAGLAYPARVWTSEGDGLVVEARFENTDPDLPSALRATQPIDVTIADLTATNGGSCEGAVFTLEHGRLIPPTSDAVWVAELERRGGAELAARREARRRMTEEELARATENSQPEFSTVLAGWNQAETDVATPVAVASVDIDSWNDAQLEQDSVAVALANADAQSSAIAAALANVGAQSASVVAQMNVENSAVAVAQLNVGAQSAASATGNTTIQNSTIAIAQVNAGTQGTVAQNTNIENSTVAVAQVNAASDFAEYDADDEYDANVSARVAPPLPTVAAMYPAGCTELACVLPATQCTAGCTPAPGACTESSCTVSGQVVELAAYPRGCATNTCAMPISRCTGACSRAPGVFINGSYSCPAQRVAVTAPAPAPQAEAWSSYQPSAPVEAEWNTAPVSVTTQTAYQVPPPQPQVVVAAPPPEVDVAVDVAAVLPWFFGAVISAPAPVPVVRPTPRYIPVPPPPGAMHGATPVGQRYRR